MCDATETDDYHKQKAQWAHLKHGKLKYFFFLWPTSSYPNPLLESVLFFRSYKHNSWLVKEKIIENIIKNQQIWKANGI